MMEWRDQGTVLSLRPQGESGALIEVFTAAHGRHAGVVRGGASRKVAPHLQPGTLVEVTWQARLGEHLGSYKVEPLRSRAGVLAERLPLAGLNATCAMLLATLPERAPHLALYTATEALFDAIAAPQTGWTQRYLRWELALLDELGYGLDLGSCAVTGLRDDLAFVSPKTGRAVSRQGAGDWADRLLPLPECMMGQGPASAHELCQGLRTTGHFLARALEARPLPPARQRFIEALERLSPEDAAR